MNNTPPVAILGALDAEMRLLEDAIEGLDYSETGHFRFSAGTIDGVPVVLVRTGMGMANAAAACVMTIERFNPNCVILQGTAGAHVPDLHIGDIVISNMAMPTHFVSTPSRPAGAGSNALEWTYLSPTTFLDDNNTHAAEGIPATIRLLNIAQDVPYAEGNLVTGIVGSGDIWNRELDRINNVHDALGTLCEDMESYSIAQVCQECTVPWLSVRIISNSEFHPEEELDFTTANTCQEFIRALLTRL
ncbi:MAG: 5'-methylthioadenosine/S-adenosylhomocysteine nucleosidase [Eggerthellaceae bacterium]|nr:5'-methylthioadenosine/S-adenosylhomocysteine nucleosidase [Eggerthellaceae bacterium]